MAAEAMVTDASNWENPVTFLNEALMLTRLEERDLSFWRLFFETQTFEIFETELTESFGKMRKREPPDRCGLDAMFTLRASGS
jgi:hypothetical protein